MSSTLPPAAETEEAFEPDTWEIPEAMPDAASPSSAGRGLPGPPPHVPTPGLPLQRPRVTPGAPPTGAASVKLPDSTQRALEARASAKGVQPPPLPRQRQPSTLASEAPAAPATPSETRQGPPGATKEWSLLNPGAAGKPPSVERVVAKPERAPAPAPATNVRRPAPPGTTTPAKSPIQPGTSAARSAGSATERPQGTAVPPPARHAGAEPAPPVARPAAQSPTLIMPAVKLDQSASARQEHEEAWDLDEAALTTVVAVPPASKPEPASRSGAPGRREASAVAPAEPAKRVESPRRPAQEAKPEAPLPRAALHETKAEPALPRPPAPARMAEAKAAIEPKKAPNEPPKAPPVPAANSVEPPPFEPRVSLAPQEDAGWLAPIIESGASLDEIESREASVLLDFDSDLLPSAAEREQQAPGQNTGESICTFWLGQDCFGLDVQLVSEVLLIDDILPVPWAPAALLGLFNSRGRIVPVVNLAALLGLEPVASATSAGPHAAPAILIKADSLVAAAIIDRPGLVVQINRGAVTPTERGSAEPWVKGHLRLDERSHSAVTLLDPESLVQRFLDMSRFPDIRACLGGAGYRPARATSAKNSGGDIS